MTNEKISRVLEDYYSDDGIFKLEILSDLIKNCEIESRNAPKCETLQSYFGSGLIQVCNRVGWEIDSGLEYSENW